MPAHPDPDALARAAGLSPERFRRVFTRWAGVGPETFVGFLTQDRAKACLRARKARRAAKRIAAWSGPLGDIAIVRETRTPGLLRRDAGDIVSYGWTDSPFGPCLVQTTARGLCGLSFAPAKDAHAEMRRARPHALFREDATAARRLGMVLFGTRRTDAGPLRLVLRGSPFQIRVWEALLRIPEGGLASYEQVAAMAGHPAAVRAAASAVGDNPIPWLIPCHRVIRKTGAFGNYATGPARKLAMIGWEAVRTGA